MGSYHYDPELAPLARTFTRIPLEGVDDVRAARRLEGELFDAAVAAVDTTGVEVTDRSVSAPGGPSVAVRVYRPAPAGDGPAPALLVLHGGGFVMGSIDAVHADATTLARELAAVVVAVGYRLAPEHPYPAAIEDCWTALCWLAGAAGGLGADPGRIGVLGRSAGGGLAAALALMTRDRGGPPLVCQHLCVPALDDRLETESMRAYTDTPTWDRASAAATWAHYLGPEPGKVSPYAAPARATDLRDLPPAYVSTTAYDPLRDEGILYALRLMQAGVSVELHTFPGTFHVSGLITAAAVTRRMIAEELTTLRRALAPDR
jgi:acetyl esterase